MEFLPRDYDFSTFPPQANPQPPKESKSSTNKEGADLFEESPFSPVYTLPKQSPPPPVKSEPHSAYQLDEEELDDCRLKSLKERYLYVERARSDPEGHWHKDQRWLESVYDRPLSPDDMQRYLESTGLEFLDAREWNCHMYPLLCCGFPLRAPCFNPRSFSPGLCQSQPWPGLLIFLSSMAKYHPKSSKSTKEQQSSLDHFRGELACFLQPRRRSLI